MGLESASFINDLVVTNPSGGDEKAQGDDHIRLIKQVLKNTFPSASAALTFGTWSQKNANYLEKTGAYTQLTTDTGKAIYFDCSGGPITYSLIAASTAKDGFSVFIGKDATANGLTIDPSGAETVNGAATLVLGPNAAGYLVCSGTGWRFLGAGTVQGPASATDKSLVLWNGTTGNLLKNGPVLGTSGQVLTSGGAGVDPSFKTLPAFPAIPTITEFDSGQLVITAAGTLTVGHSLGGIPDAVASYLQCTVGEGGYTAGDLVLLGPAGPDVNNNMGAAIVVGASSFVIRYGSSSDTFRVINKTDGSRWSITNGNWRLVIKAQRFS